MDELRFATFAELAKFLEGKTIAKVIGRDKDDGYGDGSGHITISEIYTTDGCEIHLWGRADECYFGGVVLPEERRS